MDRQKLKDYYGKRLQHSQDLQTNACCCDDSAMSQMARNILPSIHHEVRERFYGCGSPIPPLLDGRTVLDLGCGSGRDAYLLSALVGESGRVIGVDMTEEQLDIARRHLDYHMQTFGYTQANIEFHQGYIEDLRALGIAEASIDVVVSNCVINLSPDKESVLREIFRVLKPGGELFFSDVFADRRVPPELGQDPVLHGECLAGAMYTEDFRRLLQRIGCADHRTLSSAPVCIANEDIERRIGMVGFRSLTIRAFKLEELEDRCEDYGQIACYLGGIPEYPHHFDLDDHHRFLLGKPTPVCGNTAAMLSLTRLAAHFRVEGDRSTHFGPFTCSSPPSTATNCC